MKLYATITSERATKGQGGNKLIEITLIIDPVKRKEVGRVIMRYGDKGEGEHEGYTIFYYPITSNCEEQKIKNGRILLYQEKGEKQKGEKCLNCNPTGAAIVKSDCLTCGGSGWLE